MTMPLNIINPFPQGLAEGHTTSSAQDSLAQANAPTVEAKPAVSKDDRKRHSEFKQRVASCKQYRRKLIPNWTISIDYRRGKPFSSQTNDDQIAVNLDWPLTKAKQASLFSQVPQVRLDHTPETLPASNPWVLPFEKKLNDTLLSSGIETAMDECLPDCINAAGIGVVLVSYESLTEEAQLPTTLDPQADPSQPAPEMSSIPRTLDRRYIIQRISPSDLLWPINYTGANFDNAPWIGRSGRISWAEAVQRYNLKEDDKAAILGEDKPHLDRLTHDAEKDRSEADDQVGFDEVWYKEFQFDPSAQSYSTLHHLVFLSGKEEPVVDEPWKGQKIDEQSQTVLGPSKFPVRTLTINYITDETIPPSDSAIARPQINEINKGRSQMIKQRERSLPIRTMDVNRVDPMIAQGLMRGTWQAIIPVQGDGSRVITEISRAAMPQENFMFDKIARNDLHTIYNIGPNQMGSGDGVETKGEAGTIEANFKLGNGRERAKVASFFCGIAEVLAGLMCLYEDPSAFGQGFTPAAGTLLKYSILADSTVLVDANQKLAKLNQFVNTYAKSGWVNIEPVLQEIAILSGLDPTTVIQPPQPKPPVEPNISLRLTGVEDMLNPLALAFLIKSGQAPDEKLIEQAKQLIQQAVVPPAGMQMPGQVQPLGGMPMLPGPEGAPPGPGGPPMAPPSPAPPPGTPLPQPPAPPVGGAHPEMAAMDKVLKRTESGGGQ